MDVRDIAKAAFVLLTTPGLEGRIYALSGPEPLNMEEITERISGAIDQAVRYVNISRVEESRRC